MTKLIQVPDGMKSKALDLADSDSIISIESCYGACDLRLAEAKALGCEKIIHYGHSKLIESDIPIEYKEIRYDINPVPALEKEFEKISKFNSFCLAASLQFLDALEKAKKFLESKGKIIKIGKDKKLYPGQILGCNANAINQVEKEVDCILFIGSGKFHALAIKSGKPIFILDLEKSKIEQIDRSLFEKQKYAAIALAKDCKRFGILISSKPGQMNFELAKKIKNKLESKGKKAFLLLANEIRPDMLEGIDLDCYINTACPRLAIDNRTSFKKPILNPDELEIFI